MNLILGTMTFGQQTFLDEAFDMVGLFLQKGYSELDTAYVYNDGDCEVLLGALISRFGREKFRIATKVNPRVSGKLDGNAVQKQLHESLSRMKIEYADTLYLHFPDPQTPMESALDACDKAYRAGYIKELGLSNFPAWMVAEANAICKANGFLAPTVYEGIYNPLTRKAETELFAALRHFGMRFHAYNPLAGGMLTGKYTSFDDKPADGRFALRKAYPSRYWKKSFFYAINTLRRAVGEISLAEAAYRWLAFHSALQADKGDSIIIGASKLSQFRQNIEAVEKGVLPKDIVSVFEEAWNLAKADSPEYFTLFKG